jgi:two-component system heavy metal sensor histidine kinase CusS
MHSLRTRLLLGIICGMLLLLLAFSLIVYAVIHHTLINQYNASLASLARILAASVEQDENEIELEFSVQQMPEFSSRDRPIYYELWRSDGTVVLRSHLLGADNLLRIEGSVNTLIFATTRDKNSRPLRVVGLKFIPKISNSDDKKQPQLMGEQALTLVVAGETSGLYSQLRLLRWLLLVTCGVTTALSVVIAAVVVRQGLNPLSSIAAEIAAIKVNDLAVRVGTKSVPSEIAPIKNRLNDLLSRLEEAFNRERRFTADVAHELRTPLAGIRSIIEVTMSRARDTAEYRTVLSECLAIVENIQTMMNNLLMIARLDAHQITLRRVRIKLVELVNSCWLPFSDMALEREIVFANGVPLKMVCESDPENLSMIMSNLLDNAVEYTNKGGRIWLTAHQSGDCIEITVSNTGCKLTSEEASHVFDCFWRADSSRTETGIHCGLGLSLVQRIVGALGGSVSAELQEGGIFTVRLTLPNKNMNK